jgi:hypothetical protein
MLPLICPPDLSDCPGLQGLAEAEGVGAPLVEGSATIRGAIFDANIPEAIGTLQCCCRQLLQALYASFAVTGGASCTGQGLMLCKWLVPSSA